MNLKDYLDLARGYWFLGRNLLAGKITNTILDLLAFLDYRLLIFFSMWHPDMNSRLKFMRRRGVQVGENVFVDLGVFIEITSPQAVVLEDYVGLGYGCIIYAHDAGPNAVADMPMRVRETRIGYNSVVGSNSVILPGVKVGRHCGVLAGSVVTKDVPDGTVVAGNPAQHLATAEEIGLAWQEDMRKHPHEYYDHPNPCRAPSTPFDHIITWREEGIKVRDWTELRTGTPFDHILDFKTRGRGGAEKARGLTGGV